MGSERHVADPQQVERARQRLTPTNARDQLARIQKAICDPARIQILQALTAGAISVDDLATVIRREPAATSQHLRVLRNLGLVEGHRRQTRVYYQLRPGPSQDQVRSVLETLEIVPEKAS